jgi:predicted MFS family arabinose efflux permease
MHLSGGMSLAMFLLFPLYVRRLGGSDLASGLLLGVGVATSVAARPLVGVALDRFGRRRVLLWANGLNAVSFLPFLAFGRIGPGLVVATVAHCVLWGALFASYFTYAADLVPAGRRAEGIAVFGSAGMLTNGLGPSLGEVVIARAGFAAYFLTALVFALGAFALTFAVRAPHAVSAARPTGRWRAVAASGLASVFLATVVFGMGVNAAFFFVAPFTRDLGLARAAPFFATYATTSIVLRLVGRRLLDQLGPHRVAIPAFACIGAGLGLLCLLPRPGILVLAGMVCGAGHGSLFPVLNALAIERAPVRFAGTAVSLLTAASDLGAVLGTPLGGALAETVGYRGMFAFMAAATFVGTAVMAVDRAIAPRRAEG